MTPPARAVPGEARARSGPPVIDRASATDRAFLAMDTDRVPEQFGVILSFDKADGFDLARAQEVLAERVPTVPRLRQRLIRTPLGCGGPIWVDDEAFDIRRHIRVVACAQPGDEPALLDAALAVVASPLPSTAPLWAAVFITGLTDGNAALVMVLHHVLADGVGGLAVLANLVDPGAGAPAVAFPRPRPTARRLALDALLGRVRALRRTGSALRQLRASMAAGGGLLPPRAQRCSLLRRSGGRGRLAVVRVDLPALRAAVHRCGATTNDAILVAVAAALHRILLARGETVDTFAVGVPVSGHVRGEPARGNMVSPLLVRVPATGEPAQRLRQVAATVRAQRPSATGPPPIALLGWLFRPLAALGGFRWYMNHQHRLHTLVSHVRGPDQPITFGGWRIRSAIPVAVGGEGNMTVYFEVFSYAGTATITAIADPDHFPDLGALADALRAEVDLITLLAGDLPPRPRRSRTE